MASQQKTALSSELSLPGRRAGFNEWYMLFVLTACYTLAFMDSRLPLILVESIKADLSLSDTQMGVIVGPAFSITYAIAAVPIARLSDRYTRKYVIGTAIAVWSLFTAAGGAAHNFVALVLARTGLAVGESALTPAAHSMISDTFPAESRARAIAIYSTGIIGGMTLALVVGGLINDYYGWRAAMYLVGVSGLCLTLLIVITVREPTRERYEPEKGKRAIRRETIRSLFEDAVFRHTVFGGTLLCISFGGMAWVPAYMIRNFSMSSSEVGATYGIAGAIVGVVGVLAGGVINDWLVKRGPSWPFRFFSIAFAMGAVFKVVALVLPGFVLFLIFTLLSSLLVIAYPGPTYGMIQSRVGTESRSFASAVALFCLQALGISTGGLLTGWLSDNLATTNSAESLRSALMIVSLFSIWSGFHYYWATRHLEQERRVQPV